MGNGREALLRIYFGHLNAAFKQPLKRIDTLHPKRIRRSRIAVGDLVAPMRSAALGANTP